MEDNLKGKVIVRFNISIDGSIDNIAVQSRKKSKKMVEGAERGRREEEIMKEKKIW